MELLKDLGAAGVVGVLRVQGAGGFWGLGDWQGVPWILGVEGLMELLKDLGGCRADGVLRILRAGGLAGGLQVLGSVRVPRILGG